MVEKKLLKKYQLIEFEVNQGSTKGQVRSDNVLPFDWNELRFQDNLSAKTMKNL